MESSKAASCTSPIPRVDCRLQSLTAARRMWVMFLAGEAGLQQVKWINRLTVFVGDTTCNRFCSARRYQMWLMGTPTYKKAGTSGIECVWIWAGVIWQRNKENNCAWRGQLNQAEVLSKTKPWEERDLAINTLRKRTAIAKMQIWSNQTTAWILFLLKPVKKLKCNILLSLQTGFWESPCVSNINSTSHQNIFSSFLSSFFFFSNGAYC